MKLIVEAGSTKTQSALIGPGDLLYEYHDSPGINPVTDPDYEVAISELVTPFLEKNIESIFYYGSGCINDEVKEGVRTSLKKYWSHPMNIEVSEDLIAAARGLCQKQEGLVAILGTGSNIGWYDGVRIVKKVHSSGYLLGDEGSGFRLGQIIYRNLVREILPLTISQRIEEELNINSKNAIQTLYTQSNPRQFLASFARYVKMMNHDDTAKIMHEVFQPFVERMLQPLLVNKKQEVHLAGSIAFHFKDDIRYILEKFNIIAASIEQSPIEGLKRFHRYERRD